MKRIFLVVGEKKQQGLQKDTGRIEILIGENSLALLLTEDKIIVRHFSSVAVHLVRMHVENSNFMNSTLYV